MNDDRQGTCPTCGAPLPSHLARAREPDLAPWDVADIAAYPDLEDWLEDATYGGSLTESLASSDGFLSWFLVLATLSGHAAIGTEGLTAAILGFHARNVAEAKELHAHGVDGDALAAIDPNAYRTLTVLLEEMTFEAETITAEFHRLPAVEARSREVAAARQHQAANAARRAREALSRCVNLLAENEATAAERGWK